MGATEVTQGQFEGVMDRNPSEHDDCENSPVEEVNWHEAAAFTNALSDAAGLSGNVAEWCNDRSGLYFGDETDPVGDPDDFSRVYRGGSFMLPAEDARVAERSDLPPDNRTSYVGFRLSRPGP